MNLLLVSFFAFKLRTNQELQYEGSQRMFLHKEHRHDNSKRLNAVLGCGIVSGLFNQWAGWEPDMNTKAPILKCEGTTENLQKVELNSVQGHITQTHRRVYSEEAKGLFEIINADFVCTISEFFQCGAKTPKSQLLYFDGAGHHEIIGTQFKFCGLIHDNIDSSLIHIEGSSSNVFNALRIMHPHPSTELSQQPWEIDTQRAIYLAGSSTLELSNSRLYNCTSVQYGGGLRMDSSGTVNISRCQFDTITDKSNTHVNAIYCLSESKLTIKETNFINCGKEGAILWSDRENIEIIGGNFEFSKATESCCGFYVYMAGNYLLSGVTFTRCGYGGIHKHAIFYGCNAQNEDQFFIKDCVFDNCGGDEEGRALMLKFKGIKSLSNCEFKNFVVGTSIVYIELINTYEEFSIFECIFQDNQVISKGGGAGIYVTNTMNGEKANPLILKIHKCKFIKNHCQEHGGAYHCSNGTISTTSVIIEGCEFIGNSAEKEGGAICIQTSKVCKIIRCKFNQNKSIAGSGCIFIESNK